MAGEKGKAKYLYFILSSVFNINKIAVFSIEPKNSPSKLVLIKIKKYKFYSK